jgi:hypothetical protein
MSYEKGNEINPATFTERMVVFLIGTRIVFAMSLKYATIDEVEVTKELIGSEEGVHPDEITVDFMGEDIELSENCEVSPEGKLVFTTLYGSKREVQGLKPSFDMNTEVGYNLFMDFLAEKDYISAIDFN